MMKALNRCVLNTVFAEHCLAKSDEVRSFLLKTADRLNSLPLHERKPFFDRIAWPAGTVNDGGFP